MDKGQTTYFSKSEMELIKNTFSNQDVLYAVRNVMFGFKAEKMGLSEEILAILRKVFLPLLTPYVPIGSQSDLFFMLNLKEYPLAEMADQIIKAYDLVEEYLNDKLSFLEKGEVKGFNLADLKYGSLEKKGISRFVSLQAYMILANSYIDSCIVRLRSLANYSEPTEEEKLAKEKADSSK